MMNYHTFAFRFCMRQHRGHMSKPFVSSFGSEIIIDNSSGCYTEKIQRIDRIGKSTLPASLDTCDDNI